MFVVKSINTREKTHQQHQHQHQDEYEESGPSTPKSPHRTSSQASQYPHWHRDRTGSHPTLRTLARCYSPLLQVKPTTIMMLRHPTGLSAQMVAAIMVTSAIVSSTSSTIHAFQMPSALRTPQGASVRCGAARPASSSSAAISAAATNPHVRHPSQMLMASSNDDFWEQQKQIAQEIEDNETKSVREEENNKFAARRTALLVDTAFFSAIIFAFCWVLFDDPFFAFSYVFGASFGLAYTYGLGKFVETIGGSIDDVDTVKGSGVGQARFAFLIMLFILVGKFRVYGLLEIPSIIGFFTYQLGSLSQGLREIND